MLIILWFSASLAVEKVHPLQGGILRLKSRHERRPELPRQSVLTFYPELAWEFLSKQARLLLYGWRLYRMCTRVEAAKDGMNYMDTALTPVSEDELETLEMFSQNKAARDAVTHARKIKDLTPRRVDEDFRKAFEPRGVGIGLDGSIRWVHDECGNLSFGTGAVGPLGTHQLQSRAAAIRTNVHRQHDEEARRHDRRRAGRASATSPTRSSNPRPRRS